jgi:hypothetical protein
VRRFVAFTLALGLLLPPAAAARTWVIRPDSSGDFIDIQTAVDTSAVANWDTLELTNGRFTGPGNRQIRFNGKALTVRSQSGNRELCTIDSEGAGPAFYFGKMDGSNQVIESITITNGVAYAGGGILCDSLCAPTIRDCIITANQADIGGGLACFYAGNPVLVNCRIENNFAGIGGGIYAWLSSPVLERCIVYSNQAPKLMGAALGGGLYSDSLSACQLDSCIIVENFAEEYGGGAYFTGGSHDTLADCYLNLNEAGANGGAAYTAWSYPSFVGCTLNENRAGASGTGGFGGALLAVCEPSPRFEDCEFRLNQAALNGGGVSCWRASPVFIDCLIDSNTTLGYAFGTAGGGAYCEYHSDPVFTGTTLSRNSASVGAGVFCTSHSAARFTASTIGRNVAEWYGGGICCMDSSRATFAGCDVVGNIAARDYGGGAALILSPATFSGCKIDSNSANLYGGGVAIRYCSPEFDSCAISSNAAGTVGGGVSCMDAFVEASFEHCRIADNDADWGGGVYCLKSSPSFEHCSVSLNSVPIYGGGVLCDTLASPAFKHCMVDSNFAHDGSGVVCINASPFFEKCMIRDNEASYGGAGIFSANGSATSIVNCLFSGNYAHVAAGGMMSMSAADTVLHCTFVYNKAGSYGAGIILSYYSSTVIKNSVVAFSDDDGIYFHTATGCAVEYCDVYGNPDGNLTGDLYEAPPGIGVLSGTNANGDTCDVYKNIFLDPAFADTAAGDFHLADSSACIEAGDPTVGVTDDIENTNRPLPPGSNPDIGAYEYGGSSSVPDMIRDPLLPSSPVLYQNSPNPFSTITEIRYALFGPSRVVMEILDIRGRRVSCLVDEERGSGMHTARFDAENLSSGVYFARLAAGDRVVARKMVVLR